MASGPQQYLCVWPSSRPTPPTALLRLLNDLPQVNTAVGQVGGLMITQKSPLWLAAPSIWSEQCSWAGWGSALMVCYLNTVLGIHAMLQWTSCWPAVQTLLCPAVKHLQLWSLIDTKSFTEQKTEKWMGGVGWFSRLWDSVPADTFGERVFWIYTDVVINTKVDKL